MNYQNVFFMGLPRTRSKFYQKLLNQHYRMGIVHETHLITHKSLGYLVRLLLFRMGLLAKARVARYLVQSAVGGFWTADRHKFTASDLGITAEYLALGPGIGPKDLLQKIFEAAESHHGVERCGARHFTNPIFISLINYWFPNSAHVILVRDFWEIFASKREWEIQRGSSTVMAYLAGLSKLFPFWLLTKLAVLIYKRKGNVLILDHSKKRSAKDASEELLHFLGLDLVPGSVENVGLVDSSFEKTSRLPF